MIIVVDNYDSFTYNLVQYLGTAGANVTVLRNDAVTVDHIRSLHPSAIVISPGPCTPGEAGISVELVRRLGHDVPILGVCLGHQAIGEALGAKVVRANRIVHGKTSSVHHDSSPLFKSIPTPFAATRYHSLIIEKDSLPSELLLTAWTDDGIVMGIQHKRYPIFGVQFHPESHATPHGMTLLTNFLGIRQS